MLVPLATDYDAPRAGLATLVEVYKRSGEHWAWREGAMDRLSGTDAIRKGVEAGRDVDGLTAAWNEGIARFMKQRAPYLIYRCRT